MERRTIGQQSIHGEGDPPGVDHNVRVYLLSPCELRHVALQYICGEGSGFVLVGAAEQLPDDSAVLAAAAPDLAIVDSELFLGARSRSVESVLRQIREVTRVIVLAGHLDVARACTAIAHGADGYVLTSMPLDELLQALRVVAAGGIWLGEELARTIAAHFAEPHQQDEATQVARLLSQRERQILNCVARGETSKEIARGLFLSESSVRTYWYRVLGKLNALNKAEAVARAARLGLLDPAQNAEDEALMVASPRLRAILHERVQSAVHDNSERL